MTIEQYYRWINTKAGKKIKDFMNRLIPGLMPEPVPVRVPVRREDRYNRRWWNKKLSVQMKKIRKLFILLLHVNGVVSLKRLLNNRMLVQRFQNNCLIHLPANPIAQLKKPRRSPLRLRFFSWTLESAFCVNETVICETLY